jgi:hypothetical protein
MTRLRIELVSLALVFGLPVCSRGQEGRTSQQASAKAGITGSENNPVSASVNAAKLLDITKQIKERIPHLSSDDVFDGCDRAGAKDYAAFEASCFGVVP